MSVRAQAHAWELILPPAAKFVLLALADHADHAGRNSYPGIPLLARKTGYSERHVTRIIGELLDAGILVVERVASGHTPTCYQIDFTAGEQQTGQGTRPLRRRASVSPAAAVTVCHPADIYAGCQDVTPEMTSATLRGDICNTREMTSATLRGDICDAEGMPVCRDRTPATAGRTCLQPSENQQGIVREPATPADLPIRPQEQEEQQHTLLQTFLTQLAQHPQFGRDVIRYPETILPALMHCPDVPTIVASYVALRARGDYIGKALIALARARLVPGHPLTFPLLTQEPDDESHPHARSARRRGPLDARHPGSFDDEDPDLLPDFLRAARPVPTV